MRKLTVAKRACRKLGLAAACSILSIMSSGALAAEANSIPAPSTGPSSAPAAAGRPNILFILIDDMGFADLSIMGNRKIETPNLDRLARDGVLLTQFYDPAPICSPSRAGMFTGRFPAELNFVTFIDDRAANAAFGQADWLDPKLPNLANLLHSAGYATGHFGKWHMGGGRDISDAPWPTAYGFDESFTTFEGLGPRVLVADEERFLADMSGKLGQGPTFYERKSNLTQLFASKTLDFVSRQKGRPWFVQLWLNDVHDPWAPDEAQFAQVKGKGANGDDDRYLASVAAMDRTLGNLFERLKDGGQLENTLIIVTSDNGPSARQRYYQNGASAPGSVLNLRGRKGSLYEGGIRQPLIMSWPGHVKPGYRDERTVAEGVDLLPTVASVAGVARPADLPGIDLSATLQGTEIKERPPLFWSFGLPNSSKKPKGPFLKRDAAPMLAVRDGRWKLLAQPDGSNVQLYDMESDPAESNNLAMSNRGVCERLLVDLISWSSKLPD